jgi:hypothetical protein
MNSDWLTKEEDMHLAREFITKYAHARDVNTVGLFEMVVDITEKRMDFCLSEWVVMLARHFMSRYGAAQGDFVTRQVVSLCITQGHVIH